MKRRAAVVSLIGGVVGGLLGAGVMSAGHALATGVTGRNTAPAADRAKDEDATLKVAARAAECQHDHSVKSGAGLSVP